LPSLSFTGLLRFVFFPTETSWFYTVCSCCAAMLLPELPPSMKSSLYFYLSVCSPVLFFKHPFLLLVLALVYFLLKMFSCSYLGPGLWNHSILFALSLSSLKLHRMSSSIFDTVLIGVPLQFFIESCESLKPVFFF
jgi:hypothetical protein